MNTILIPDFTDLLHKYHDKYGDECFDGHLENFPFSDFKLIINSKYPIDVTKIIVHIERDYASIRIVKWDLSKDERVIKRYDIKEIEKAEFIGFIGFKINYFGEIIENIVGDIDLEKCYEEDRWETYYWNLSDEISIVLRYIYFELKNRIRITKEIEKKMITRSNDMNQKRSNLSKRVFLLNEICDYFYLDEKQEKDIIHKRIDCPCWSVRGHYRHYKSGKVVFVKEHKKGKDRENAQPKDKTYTA